MRSTTHYEKRLAQRGFSTRGVQCMFKYADYVEQKGQCYVLDFTNPQRIHEIKASLATEEQEKWWRLKKLERLCKLAIKKEDQIETAALEKEIQKLKSSIKDLRRERKSVKPGFVVIGSSQQELGAVAITSFRKHSNHKLRGSRTIREVGTN